MKTKLLLFLLVCLLIPVTASAHPGGLDDNGGHINHATGEYHYHHGYEAHQHPDGVCPYDFDDRTGQNSGTPSSGQASDPSPAPKEPEWVLVKEGFGVDFYYCEATDQWKSQDGTIYDSTANFYQTFGFTYDPDDQRWYSDYGYIDADGNYCLYEDCGMYVCPECGYVIEDDNDHAEGCGYKSFSYLDSESLEEPPMEDGKDEDGPLETWVETFFLILGLGCIALPFVLWAVLFVASLISDYRKKKL